MGFIREDYVEKKTRAKLKITFSIFGAAVAVLVVLLVWPKASGSKKEADRTPQKPFVMAKVEVSANLDLPAIVKKVQGGVVTIETFDKSGNPIGVGTGFVVTDSGQIVTNRHVFLGADKAKVKINNQTYSVSGFLAEDVNSDLILVTVSGSYGKRWTGLKMNSRPPDVGERIFVIGNPLGLELSVSDGIVAARREIQPFGQVIQITSPISPGSSGSPVLNMRGEVVGIATFQSSRGQNLNFAIPIEKVVKMKPTTERILARMSTEINEKVQKMGDPLEKAAYLISEEQYEEAIPYCEELINKDYNDAKAHCYLGAAYINSKPDRARKELMLALEMNPKLPEGHHYLGVLYFETKQYAQAMASIEEALRLKPEYFDAMVDLGMVYFTVNRFKSAADLLNQALNQREDSRLYTWLGLTYARMSKDLDAIRVLERAIDMDDNAKDAYIALAYVMIKVKNWKRGIRYMTTAALKWSQVPEMRFLLGIFYLGDEDVESAEEQAEILGRMNKVKDSSTYRGKLQQAIYDYKNYRRYRGY